jgi:glycerol-3-phosphate O-acyltransferase/dihydroxyacetone phosphate acyltransferase
LKPFSTIDGNLDEVKRRLTDGVKQRTRKRRSSGDGAWDDEEEEEEGLVMGRKDRSFTR